MGEEEFNAKQRLEEGVSVFDLVKKCPRDASGDFWIDDISNRRFCVSAEAFNFPATDVGRRISTVGRKIVEISGKDIEITGGNKSQSKALRFNALPDIEEALEAHPELSDVFKNIYIKMKPESGTTTTHDEDGETAMAVQEKVTAETVAADLKKYTNVIVEGVAGCGKSHLLEGLTEKYEDRVRVVVFHPATSYEDFVSGLRPTSNMGFTGEAGVFVEMCEEAAAHPDDDYLLFIDEINRANTSRVFGDLMLVLEASKRVNLSEAAAEDQKALLVERTSHTITLQTPVDQEAEGPSQRFRYLQVPQNLHVLGTMNTTDRSVGTIDLALRRRFHWITMHPMDEEQLRIALDREDEVVDALITWYAQTNEQLQIQVGPDARLGHSYFFGKGRSVEDVATDLLNQLKEVVATFNIHEEKIKAIVGPGASVGEESWTIVLQGQGLGRRPEIERRPRPTEQASTGAGGSGAPQETDTRSGS